MPGTLFVVATPIGNLSDFSARGIETLKTADLIACEDTRVTKKLTDRFGIETPRTSLHAHTEDKKVAELIRRMEEGESIAYVSDAGTPGVNDPGGKLVAAAFDAGIAVTPIPGASALTAAISVCGFPMERFDYLGFIPHKKRRETFLREAAESPHAVVFLESTHRVMKTLAALHETLDPKRQVFIGRELTKQHETIYRGSIDEVEKAVKDTSSKGEFIVILAPT